MKAESKRPVTVVHLQLNVGDQHFYFGSLSAIYERFSPEVLGVALQTLYQHRIQSGKPYRNERCIIRKGIVHRKVWSKNRTM